MFDRMDNVTMESMLYLRAHSLLFARKDADVCPEGSSDEFIDESDGAAMKTVTVNLSLANTFVQGAHD